jgi:hypothetical protein
MRRIALAAPILLALLAAAWSAFWFHAAGMIETGVAEWVEARRAQGFAVEYASLAVEGFPFHWRVAIDQPHLAGIGPAGWDWRGDRAVATLQPWALRDIPLSFAGAHRISGGTGDLAETVLVSATRPAGRIMLDEDGRLDRLSFDLGDATIRRDADPAAISIARLRLEVRPYRRPDPASGADVLDLAFDAETVKLPAAPPNGLGDVIAKAHTILSVKGALPPGPLQQSIPAWRDAGGVIDANRIALRWGPLEIDGDGTLALDDEERPLGAFTARIRGYGETIDALAMSGLVRPREAAAVKIALNMLARQDDPRGARALKIPVTAQDGRLTVAGFPLARIPALRFE